MFNQAVVLAAGEGERLRPFTASKPKVMIRVANKPVLQYVVEALANNGIRRLIFVVGYKKEKIMDYFGDGSKFGVEIEYVVQEHLLGTGDALRCAEDMVDHRFLVLSGDNVIDAATIAKLLTADENAILIKPHEDVSRYGVVMLDGDYVRDIVEKPGEEISNLINTGIYAFDRTIFDFLEDELPVSLMKMVRAGYPVRAYETHDAWLDAVYPWDILRLNDIVLKTGMSRIQGKVERGVTITGSVSVGENTVIRANSYLKGPLLIGDNCEIGPNVCIYPSTSIGNDVRIEAFTELRNSVIMDMVSIGSFCSIHDSIFDTGTEVKGGLVARSEESTIEIGGEHHKLKSGMMVGEYCELGNNIIATAGTIIGNRVTIKSLKELRGRIPDGSLVV